MNSKAAETRYRNAITRSVAKNRSATRPTKNGETSEASDTVEKTRPACVPVKCSVCVRYVVMVTYHAPQMTYWMNIMIARRVFRNFMSGPLWSFDSHRSLVAGAGLRATSSYINIPARSFGNVSGPHRRAILPRPDASVVTLPLYEPDTPQALRDDVPPVLHLGGVVRDDGNVPAADAEVLRTAERRGLQHDGAGRDGLAVLRRPGGRPVLRDRAHSRVPPSAGRRCCSSTSRR